MFLPVLAPHLPSPSSGPGEFAPVDSRFAAGAVLVRVESGGGRRPWLLVDSGTVETLVRRDRVDAGGTLTLRLGDARVALPAVPVARSEFPPTVAAMGADGLLGNDGLRRLGVFIDYSRRRVFARASGGGSGLEGALAAAGRGEAEPLSFPLALDREGWYHTAAVRGNSPLGAIWDTGSTGYEVVPGREDLGPQLGRIEVARPNGTTFHGVHLIPLALGEATIPILAFRRRADDPDPITIGPHALTGEWTYLDAAGRTAAIPRPDPKAAAERTLANLLRRTSVPTTLFGRPASEAVAGMADVGSDAGLARARRIAARAATR